MWIVFAYDIYLEVYPIGFILIAHVSSNFTFKFAPQAVVVWTSSSESETQRRCVQEICISST